jgi:hypothetical protein
LFTDPKVTIRWQTFIAITLGILAFFLVVGPTTLNPLNENWLLVGNDVTQHYLGWVFFRHSPWSFPIGLNPTNGLEFSSSIVYSDSIPILAFIFKFLSPILPEPFQYMGFWLCLCFILHAYFTWKLVALISSYFWVRFFSTILFLFSPILLFRTDMEKPQVGHFFILAALLLNLKRDIKGRYWWWFVLLIAALLVNFYIFAMVLGLYLADLLDRLVISKTLSYRIAILQMLGLSGSILLVLWQAGYFAVPSAGQWGFGFFKLNLLGFFNPLGWSYVLPDIPMQSSWAEGYMYIGLGVILGFILILPGCLSWPRQIFLRAKERPFFYCIILGFFIFSISNQIGIGLWEFSYPLPEAVLKIAAILRASARMFWPVYYFLYLFLIYELCRCYSKSVAVTILSILCFIQGTDLYAGWKINRAATSSLGPAIYSNPLPSPIWSELIQQYNNIKLVAQRDQLIPDNMARFLAHEWKRFGRLASQYGLGTNTTYLTRGDQPELRLAVNTRLLQAMQNGIYEPSTLYVIPDKELGRAWCGMLNQPNARLIRIDDYNILAPNYANNSHLMKASPNQLIDLASGRPQVSQAIQFGVPDKATSQYHAGSHFVFCEGWGDPEPWGIWSDGNEAKLYLPLPEGRSKNLVLQFQAFVFDSHPEQAMDVRVNDRLLLSLSIKAAKGNRLVIPLEDADWIKGYVLVQFTLKNPISPKQAKHSIDDRKLAIGLESAVFQP